MPGHGVRADSDGVRLLPKEIARFLNSQDWLFGASVADKPRVVKRRLNIEPLESRRMMDAAAAASLVNPLWFQNVAGASDPAHVGTANWSAESLGPSTVQSTAASTTSQDVYDWIVQFDTASLGNIASVAQTASLLVGGGAEFQVLEGLGLTGMVLVRSSGESLDAVEQWLGSNVNVASFERDAFDQIQSVPSDPQYNQLWGMTSIDAPGAWNTTTGSSSVVVAVIDTGVDYNHRDLAANIWTNPGEIAGNGVDDDRNGFVDDIHGYDFANNDGNPMDDNGHGTHVSGTIAAVANNGQGVAGVNWSSSVMALKFLGSDGSGYLSDAIRAVNYATMMRTQYGVNVRVMNNSWGGGEYSAALESAIRASGNADILFVAAAGNDGTNNDANPQYPANYNPPNVISVAAVDQNDRLASFSCYGATTVDVAAPGVSIYSTTPGNRYAIYSGTSMATPFVTGVAALAWAADPTASVAEVRNAIIAGADRVASLSGKVASGVLNARTTLALLDQPAPSGPSIGAVVASPNSVSIGNAAVLTASGVAASGGTVTNVSFYLDGNNNRQYDSSDQLLGWTGAVANGQASVTINSSNVGAGSHSIIARAQDNHGAWSSCVATTLTVLQGDDHGNNAASATTVAAPSTTAGVIGVNGDVDWFKFQATAGKAYVFTVQLGTLQDSVLTLCDSNGTTQLAFNDDSGSSAASQITWTAPTSGVYYLAVGAYGNAYTGTYSLSVQGSNAAPTLATIADQTLPYGQTTLVVNLRASDPDGDSLTYTAHAMTVDQMSQKAFSLDQQLGLHTFPDGKYYYNYRGAGERYLLGNGNVMYFIRPNGSLYRWGGSIAGSTLVDTLSPAYYANPALLHSARTPSLTSISSASVETSISGDTLTVTRSPGFTGVIHVQVTVSDGDKSDSQVFAVSDSLAQTAYDLDRQLGLHKFLNGKYYGNLRGVGEKYMLGNGNLMYFIRPDGSLYRWGGSIGRSPLVATLSPAYWSNPTLLHDAQPPTSASMAAVPLTSQSVESATTAWAASDLGPAPADSLTSSVATDDVAQRLRASLHDEVLAQLAAVGLGSSGSIAWDHQAADTLVGSLMEARPSHDDDDAVDLVFGSLAGRPVSG